jgi:O-antigen/teichoic acid export membrane protein
MSIISLSTVVLTQVDKVVLSRTLTLAAFGYYSLAWTLASGFSQLRDPVFNAVFPALSGAVARREEGEEASLYHAASQSMALLVVPALAVVVFFAGDIIRAWTGDAAVAHRTAWLLTTLGVGSACNALAAVPFALQLAHGWTRLAVASNLLGIALLVPSVLLLAVRYGAVGAAVSWAALNAGYVLFQTRAMHRRLLTGHLRRWYLGDIGRPILVSTCAAGVMRLVLPHAVREHHAILCLAAAYLAAAAATLVVLPLGRAWVSRRMAGAPTSSAGAV